MFSDDYHLTACINLLKWAQLNHDRNCSCLGEQASSDAMSEDGKKGRELGDGEEEDADKEGDAQNNTDLEGAPLDTARLSGNGTATKNTKGTMRLMHFCVTIHFVFCKTKFLFKLFLVKQDFYTNFCKRG